jgi:uncharacterized protein YbaA (DUF1428 family)
MARYVDGFVLPLPKKNLEAYRRMAREAGCMFWGGFKSLVEL